MRDLFGEVPVSVDDVRVWLRAVAGISPSSPRAAAYVRNYNVVEKIRAAKLAGAFDALENEVERRGRGRLAGERVDDRLRLGPRLEVAGETFRRDRRA